MNEVVKELMDETYGSMIFEYILKHSAEMPWANDEYTELQIKMRRKYQDLLDEYTERYNQCKSEDERSEVNSRLDYEITKVQLEEAKVERDILERIFAELDEKRVAKNDNDRKEVEELLKELSEKRRK